MNVGDYAAGCVALTLTLLPWAFAANQVAWRVLPEWRGAAHVLAASVLGVSGILVIAELLGMLGLFSRWWLAAAAAAISAGVIAIVPAGTPQPRAPELAGLDKRTTLGALGFALIAALAVSAALLGRDARVLTTGPTDDDALHYHLSESVWFVQTHSINHLHQTAASDASVYYPLDDELLDAVAMMGPRPDIATLGLTIGFAWLALLACWVIGARWSMGPAAVAAGSSVLAIPLIAGAASGPGLNDIPSLAVLMAAIAVVVHAEGRERWLSAIGVAGLALGLAAGSKLSLLAAVVLIALTAVICAPTRRWVSAGVVTVTAIATGGFWFIRDWVAVGSPVPSVNLTVGGHGFHQVPYPQVKPVSFTVAHYFTNWSVIRHSFVPALKVVATPIWPVVLGLPAIGIVAAIVLRGDRIRRLLGVVAVVGVAAYLVTPNTALGPEGHPILFGANLRYLAPVLALAVILLVTAPPLRRFALPVTVVFSALTIALLASSTTSAYVDRRRGLAIALALAITVAWLAVVARRAPRLVTVAVSVLALLIVANGGYSLQKKYLTHRFAAPGPRNKVFALGTAVHHVRIGVAGEPLQYPFYGPTFDNTVQYVGVEAPDHSFGAPTTCQAWTNALANGRYQYVVIEPGTVDHPAQLTKWTQGIAGARLIGATSAGYVFKLSGSTVNPLCAAPR